jgi:hypothetical protein
MFKSVILLIIVMFSAKTSSPGHSGQKKLLHKLVDSLVDKGIIKTPKVNQAMRHVDRADYYHGHGAY